MGDLRNALKVLGGKISRNLYVRKTNKMHLYLIFYSNKFILYIFFEKNNFMRRFFLYTQRTIFVMLELYWNNVNCIYIYIYIVYIFIYVFRC